MTKERLIFDTRPPPVCADAAQGGGPSAHGAQQSEQHYDAVLAVIRDGLTVSEAAIAYGVSRQTIYRWIRRYEDGGLPALAERSHRPKACPHRIDPRVEGRIVTLRQGIQHQFGRKKLKEFPSHRAIHRAPFKAFVSDNFVYSSVMASGWQQQRPSGAGDGVPGNHPRPVDPTVEPNARRAITLSRRFLIGLALASVVEAAYGANSSTDASAAITGSTSTRTRAGARGSVVHDRGHSCANFPTGLGL